MADVNGSRGTEAQRLDETKLSTLHRGVWWYLLDVSVIVVMGTLLYNGALVRFLAVSAEPIRYRCYALAFYHGLSSLGTLRKTDCWFVIDTPTPTFMHLLRSWHVPGFLMKVVEQQSSSQPFHNLPHEYPLLAMIPFTFTLFASYQWFLIEFAIWMALIAGVIYFVLKQCCSTSAALVFAFYLIAGNWATALARFDLIPVGLTLGAVILAERSKWRWAFALLALAILLKFYALVLVPPLFIAQQRQLREYRWSSMRRWDGILTFVVVCGLVTVISFALSIDGTLGPLGYFGNRPIQIESLAATVLWLGHFVGYPVHYEYTFGSLNAVSLLSSEVSLLSTLCFAAGLLLAYWLQMRGRIDIFKASLLALLISMVTGKIFSPQYLMWVTPFIAYIGKVHWKWLLSWGLVCVLTTCIYPYMYNSVPNSLSVPLEPLFYPFVLLRGIIILAIIFALFYRAIRPQRKVVAPRPVEVVARVTVSSRA